MQPAFLEASLTFSFSPSPPPTLHPQMTLLQMASVAKAADSGNAHKDISPFSAELFGKNAQTGGVWTTMRMPFGSSVRVTLQQASSCNTQGTYWIIVRGVEALPITLSEVELPATARLQQFIITNETFAARSFIGLANASAGYDGMLLSTFIDATSNDPNYLEGCFHITHGDGTENFLSSGTEDYFLSASYFDEGIFASSQAGLTWRGDGGDLSAYKTHTRDLVPFHNGMQFVWRNNEDQNCPNHWDGVEAARPLRTGPLTLSSIVYLYTWPTA